jgi:hypothetical protein
LYLCLPLIRGSAGGGYYFPITCGIHKEKTQNKKSIKSRDAVVQKDLPSCAQQGASQSGKPPQEAGIPSKPRDIEHKMSQKCKFIQINLRHSKAATALLCQKLAIGEIDKALIQEPLVCGDRKRALLNIRGTLFPVGPCIVPRSCIFVRNTVHAFSLSELCSLDVTSVRVTYIRGVSKRELTVTSAYLPYDSEEPPPSKGLREVVDYYSRNKLQLIVGCDANAHHIIWGSMDINP